MWTKNSTREVRIEKKSLELDNIVISKTKNRARISRTASQNSVIENSSTIPVSKWARFAKRFCAWIAKIIHDIITSFPFLKSGSFKLQMQRCVIIIIRSFPKWLLARRTISFVFLIILKQTCSISLSGLTWDLHGFIFQNTSFNGGNCSTSRDFSSSQSCL